MRAVLGALLLLVALAGCTEREQIAKGVKTDTAAYTGTGHPQFTAPGWKPGDRASWETETKERTMMGQNDYAKVP